MTETPEDGEAFWRRVWGIPDPDTCPHTTTDLSDDTRTTYCVDCHATIKTEDPR